MSPDKQAPEPPPQSLVEWLKSLQAQGIDLKGGKLTVKLPPLKPKPDEEDAPQLRNPSSEPPSDKP
jgi:hypothetical protein